MSDEAKESDRNPPVRPFVVIALVTCVTGYPVAVALQLLSKGSSNFPDILDHTAIVFGCCWALYSVAAVIAWRTWRLWHR
jgi:hypothetical protein